MNSSSTDALGTPRQGEEDSLLAGQYRNASNLDARVSLHERFSTATQPWLHWVFDHLLSCKGADLLEAGCGNCALWRANRQRIPGEWRVTLTDFSLGMLRDGRDSLAPHAGPFRSAAANACALPFPGESFDAVAANHMLYHVPDPSQAISEFHRVLRPGGLLFASTNGGNHMREVHEWVVRFAVAGYKPRSLLRSDFSLETGHEQLAPHFTNIRLLRFDDGLKVTETAPLLAWILSTPARDSLKEDAVERLAAFLDAMLREDGAIRITKETGLFAAVRA